MSENNYTVLTTARRIELCKASSGAAEKLPKIAYMAFGKSGLGSDGKPLTPDPDQNALKDEVCRYEIEEPAYPEVTTARYHATIPKGEHGDEVFSEVGLYNEDGVLCIIRNMLPKSKDIDVPFTVYMDEQF